MTKINGAFFALLLGVALAGCQSSQMQGQLKGDYYYSPAAAYALDLSVSTFRGRIVLDERCDSTGGSTTFWDPYGRLFRFDYLDVRENTLVNAPKFASDMTLLNLVLNNYLRERLAQSDILTEVEAAHRELIETTDPKSVLAIAKITVDNENAPREEAIPKGTYYYGFLLFKKGDIIYVLQHRQDIFAPSSMKAVLMQLAGAMDIPGKTLSPSDYDRMRHMLSKLAPGDTVSPLQMCNLNS